MRSMLNEFYDFIAKKINSYFQSLSADGLLQKGESFCLKLDDVETVENVRCLYGFDLFSFVSQRINRFRIGKCPCNR